MEADTRKSLAEQLLANPLLEIELNEMEKRWTNALIAAHTEEGRITNQALVRAIRIFRADLVGTLSTRAPRTAPA